MGGTDGPGKICSQGLGGDRAKGPIQVDGPQSKLDQSGELGEQMGVASSMHIPYSDEAAKVGEKCGEGSEGNLQPMKSLKEVKLGSVSNRQLLRRGRPSCLPGRMSLREAKRLARLKVRRSQGEACRNLKVFQNQIMRRRRSSQVGQRLVEVLLMKENPLIRDSHGRLVLVVLRRLGLRSGLFSRRKEITVVEREIQVRICLINEDPVLEY